MNVQSTNSNYQSYVATCTAQTGSRQLAAQVSQSLSELTVALPMRVENMIGFNKKGPPKKLFFCFVTTVLCYIHYVNHAALVLITKILIQLSFAAQSLIYYLYYDCNIT